MLTGLESAYFQRNTSPVPESSNISVSIYVIDLIASFSALFSLINRVGYGNCLTTVHRITVEKLETKIRKSISLNEKSRLEHLNGYKIIRSKSSKVFDELAAYTANLFNTQIAVINFVDQNNVWIKKGQPLKNAHSLRVQTSVCSLAIATEEEHIFKGLFLAPSLVTNPIVVAELGMAFYAAVPIVTEEGIQVGTVCIADKTRREFLFAEREKLEWVAKKVSTEMRKKTAQKLFA